MTIIPNIGDVLAGGVVWGTRADADGVFVQFAAGGDWIAFTSDDPPQPPAQEPAQEPAP